jgi:hypothetical protein
VIAKTPRLKKTGRFGYHTLQHICRLSFFMRRKNTHKKTLLRTTGKRAAISDHTK